MTQTEQEAREQLVEAMEQAIRESLVAGGVIGEYSESLGCREEAEAALTVDETLRTKCERCGGAGDERNYSGSCPDCSGTGLGLLAIDAARGLHFSHGLYSFPSARPTETKP